MKRFFGMILALALLLATPALALTDEEMDAAAAEIGQAAVDACVTEDMTDLETLTALHDWFALHCDYGAALRGETAYGALAEETAVCVGYAEGYALLASLAGLDGVTTYSEDMDHAWILATLDGVRYFSDVTWDDGKNQKLGLIRHAYFLFSEYNAESTGHYGWDSDEYVPGGGLESVPWAAAVTRVIFDGAYAYFIDGEFRLWRCDRSTWETECLVSMPDRWPDGTGTLTPEQYTGLVLVRDRLYFNTPRAICYYDLRTNAMRYARVPNTANGLLYGLGVRDGTLCCSLAADKDALAYDILDTGISARGAWGY